MRKILIFVGSRANYGRLRSVCKAIQEHEALELQLILGASFYDKEVEFPVDSRIQCLINSDDHEGMALTTGILLTKVSAELARLKPDVVLVHGDRYEVLAVVQAAAYMNIPLAHTEGGEVTGCIDDKVRNAITALADIHFPVTDTSGHNIYVNSNVTGKNIHVVGSTALDSIKDLRHKKINNCFNYMVVLYHPETTKNEDIKQLIHGIERFKYKKGFGINYVVWVNPNSDAGSRKILKDLHATDWCFEKDLSPLEYAELIQGSRCVIGNSSSFIKEASFLGVPAVIVGDRQKGREMDDNCICVPIDKDSIEEALIKQWGKSITYSNYFGDGTASQKIANILAEVEL